MIWVFSRIFSTENRFFLRKCIQWLLGGAMSGCPEAWCDNLYKQLNFRRKDLSRVGRTRLAGDFVELPSFQCKSLVSKHERSSAVPSHSTPPLYPGPWRRKGMSPCCFQVWEQCYSGYLIGEKIFSMILLRFPQKNSFWSWVEVLLRESSDSPTDSFRRNSLEYLLKRRSPYLLVKEHLREGVRAIGLTLWCTECVPLKGFLTHSWLQKLGTSGSSWEQCDG